MFQLNIEEKNFYGKIFFWVFAVCLTGFCLLLYCIVLLTVLIIDLWKMDNIITVTVSCENKWESTLVVVVAFKRDGGIYTGVI